MATQLDGRAQMTPEQVEERRARARSSARLLGVMVLLIFLGSIAYNMGLF